jgi:hypothetical protein
MATRAGGGPRERGRLTKRDTNADADVDTLVGGHARPAPPEMRARAVATAGSERRWRWRARRGVNGGRERRTNRGPWPRARGQKSASAAAPDVASRWVRSRSFRAEPRRPSAPAWHGVAATGTPAGCGWLEWTDA